MLLSAESEVVPTFSWGKKTSIFEICEENGRYNPRPICLNKK
jgi:hypothetical protein